MWRNMVQSGMPQMTIRRMRFACWITKTTDTHSEHVILLAFPRQQLLRESNSMLCSYVHYLSWWYAQPHDADGQTSTEIRTWSLITLSQSFLLIIHNFTLVFGVYLMTRKILIYDLFFIWSQHLFFSKSNITNCLLSTVASHESVAMLR